MKEYDFTIVFKKLDELKKEVPVTERVPTENELEEIEVLRKIVLETTEPYPNPYTTS